MRIKMDMYVNDSVQSLEKREQSKCHHHYYCCPVAMLCPTLCDPMGCSLPGSSVHGISQARILEWVTNSFSRGSSWSKDWTRIPCIGKVDSLPLSHQRSPLSLLFAPLDGGIGNESTIAIDMWLNSKSLGVELVLNSPELTGHKE